MKKNFVQSLCAGIFLLLFISCKKEIDKPLSDEEVATASFLSAHTTAQPQQRPFKGQIVGSFLSTPGPEPGIYNSSANASGNVTHLGFFTKTTNDVVNLASSTVEGTFIMTSVGGEQITGMYSGTFSFGTTPGTFSWNLDARITGGSGRFLNATGQFVFIANGNHTINEGIVNGDYTETFDGTIIY